MPGTSCSEFFFSAFSHIIPWSWTSHLLSLYLLKSCPSSRCRCRFLLVDRSSFLMLSLYLGACSVWGVRRLCISLKQGLVLCLVCRTPSCLGCAPSFHPNPIHLIHASSVFGSQLYHHLDQEMLLDSTDWMRPPSPLHPSPRHYHSTPHSPQRRVTFSLLMSRKSVLGRRKSCWLGLPLDSSRYLIAPQAHRKHAVNIGQLNEKVWV